MVIYMKIVRVIFTALAVILCHSIVYAADMDSLPFENKGPKGEIIIENAAQLASIQGLATLYIETGGKQGSLDFLVCPKKMYVLAADIDLPADWTPIGDASSNVGFVFRGSFDGKGHTIRGLSIKNKPCAAQGLFGKVEGASISNLILEDAVILLEGPGYVEAVGLLAGEAKGSRFRNISIINGEITVDSNEGAKETTNKSAIGGLVGRITDSMVDGVSVRVDINVSAAKTGGLAGHAIDTRFYNSGINEGNIIGSGISGGFIGRLDGNGPVLGCHSSANVTGSSAGGFIGQIFGPEITTNANHALEIINSKSMGKTISTDGPAGGFAGEASYALIKDCAAYGDVRGTTAVGGFVGGLYDYSRVISSYSKAEVRSQRAEGRGQGAEKTDGGAIGGFVGEIAWAACIEFGYSSGAVIAGGGWDGAVGGFVGVISSEGAPNTITHSLSFAPWVVGGAKDYVHRFAGRAEHLGINGCYAHLGSQVVKGGALSHVLPSAYGLDGADMSGAQVEDVAGRIGWKFDLLP